MTDIMTTYHEAVIMDIGTKEPEQQRRDDLLMALYKAGPAAMLDDMRSLHTIMDYELSALEERNIAPLQENEETKRALIERMQIYTAVMQERPEWALALPEDDREDMRALRRTLDTKGDALLTALLKMRRLHDVMMRAIRKSVDQGIKAQGGYGAGGSQEASTRDYMPFTLSESC